MVGGTGTPPEFDGVGRSVGLICYKKFKITGKFTCPEPPPPSTGTRQDISADSEPTIKFEGTMTINCECDSGPMPDEWGGVGFPPVSPEDLDTGNFDSGGQNCDDDFVRQRWTTTFPCEQRETIEYDGGTTDVVTWIGCVGDKEKEVEFEMSLSDMYVDLLNDSGYNGYTGGDVTFSMDSAEGKLAVECGAKQETDKNGEQIANLGAYEVPYHGGFGTNTQTGPAPGILECMVSKMCCGGGGNGASAAMNIMQGSITNGEEETFECVADYSQSTL